MYNLDSGECWLLNESLNYCTTLQLELFCQRSGKWENGPEKREACGRQQKLRRPRISGRAAASMARVPIAPPALGDPPSYSAEGAEGGEPELVSPSWIHQVTKLRGEASTEAGQSQCKGKEHWNNECPSEGKRGWESENLGKTNSGQNFSPLWLIPEWNIPWSIEL